MTEKLDLKLKCERSYECVILQTGFTSDNVKYITFFHFVNSFC